MNPESENGGKEAGDRKVGFLLHRMIKTRAWKQWNPSKQQRRRGTQENRGWRWRSLWDGDAALEGRTDLYAKDKGGGVGGCQLVGRGSFYSLSHILLLSHPISEPSHTEERE